MSSQSTESTILFADGSAPQPPSDRGFEIERLLQRQRPQHLLQFRQLGGDVDYVNHFQPIHEGKPRRKLELNNFSRKFFSFEVNADQHFFKHLNIIFVC
jgi:hypothetical protein